MAKTGNFRKTLTTLSALSLVALIFLRLYAVIYTVPVRTWDDRYYRNLAVEEGKRITLSTALEHAFLPNHNNLNGDRTAGYHSWLVLTYKLFPNGEPEHTFQWLNIFFYFLQAIVIMSYSFWITRDQALSLAISFLYLSTPLVFGLNRWIFTENLVFPGLLVFSFLPPFFLARGLTHLSKSSPHAKFQHAVEAFGLAWILGIFTSMREYTLPSTIVTALLIFSLLLKQNKRLPLLCFTATFSPFAIALGDAVGPVIDNFKIKAQVSLFLTPMGKWLWYVFIYSVGPALTSLFILAVILMSKRARFNPPSRFSNILKTVKRGLKANLSPEKIINIFFISNICLIIIYFSGIISNSNRTARSITPIIVTGVSAVLLGYRKFELGKNIQVVYRGMLLLVILSWGFFIYQLFFAFDGGKTYGLHPFKLKLEIYNHPLNLPTLKDSNDLHVRPKWTKDVPFWNLSKDTPDD